MTPFDVVIPASARPQLAVSLRALAAARGPAPRLVIVIDDRPGPVDPPGSLDGEAPAALRDRLVVLPGSGRGPVAARDLGWRAGTAPWIVFLEAGSAPWPDWLAALATDLSGAAEEAGAVRGHVRAPTEGDAPVGPKVALVAAGAARRGTQDVAYRRSAVMEAGGFDERFETVAGAEADLAVRMDAAGWSGMVGSRSVTSPAVEADPWQSLRLAAEIRDEALLRTIHGRVWRRRVAEAMRSEGLTGEGGRARLVRIVAQAATTTAGLGAILAFRTGRAKLAGRAGAAWAAGTAAFAWSLLPRGRVDRTAVRAALTAGALVPPVALALQVVGQARSRVVVRGPGPAPSRADGTGSPRAVLFDRDGTLVVPASFDHDLERVQPMPGAARALGRLRASGVAVGMVSDGGPPSSRPRRRAEARRLDRRVEELLGPFDVVATCTHGRAEGCRCRKPAPGNVIWAAHRLGVDPSACAVVGDADEDVVAGLAAGARAVLVPNGTTSGGALRWAPEVEPTIEGAVDLLLHGSRGGAAR